MGKRVFIGTLTILFLLCHFLTAQVVQTGNLEGTVRTVDGEPLPGVTVTLTSPALIIGKQATVTNQRGAFRFMALPPGTYEVRFELEGFQPVIQKDVVIRVAQTITVDITMKPKTMEEQLTVIAAAPTIDKQRTTRPTNLDVVYLSTLPATRTLGTFFNMTPGVTGDSAHGSSTMDNTYNLDGINMVDPATGVPNVNFGMDIMEEISVQSGGLPAEYGSVRGAVVNVVSKSGGNRFSGTAQFFLDHEKLKSDNTKGTPFEGSKSGAKYQIEPVVTLGGPIVREKAWFFTNLSFQQSESFAAGYPWGSQAGQEKPIKTTLPYPFVKLSFQPNQENKFSLTYNYSDRRTNDRNASLYYTEEATVKQVTPTHVMSLQWTRAFGSNLFTNLRFGMVLFKMNLDAKGDQPQYYDSTASPVAKYYGNYWRNKDHYTRNRFQVNGDATYFLDNLLGSHEIKGGFEVQMAYTTWYIYGVGDWTSTDGTKMGCSYTMRGQDYVRCLVLVNNGFNRKDNVEDIHGFIQDTWSINKHLNVSLGLRAEYNSVVYPKQNTEEGPIVFQGKTYDRSIPERTKMYSWFNLAPRLGIIYDIVGDGKNVFKASWGRYILPNQTGWINLAHPNGWFGYYQQLNADGTLRLDANGNPMTTPWAMPGGFKNGGAVIGYTDPQGKEYKLKAGYTDELTVAFERELAKDWTLSLRYIKKWDRRQPYIVDAAQLDLDKLMTKGELDWSKNWTPVTCIDPYNRQPIVFYEKQTLMGQELHIINPPGANRDYDGFEVTFDKRFSKNYSMNISYVWAYSRGLITTARNDESLGGGAGYFYSDPNAHTNAYGRFPLERRNQLKVTGVVRLPFDITLSGYFRALSGTRTTRTINTIYANIYVQGTTTAFRPRQGDVSLYAEKRGSTGLPDLWLLDLHLEKTFRIKRTYFGVFADCFNVFNEMIITGWNMVSNNPNTPYLRQTGINDPRIFRLGARFGF